jgi:hypothetical protein
MSEFSDFDSELEREFKVLQQTIGKEIEGKLETAAKLIKEACDIADEHGYPFYSSVSVLGQEYIPSSFKNRFEGMSPETIENLVGISAYDIEYAHGWKHSAVC